uniref:Uncharacterized protein n=1 Tax=Trichuris muris TaxID=70415 RepID=A0A5S6Q6K9_TRIMR
MASGVELSAPVGHGRRRDCDRGRSEPSPIMPERRALRLDVSYSREVAKEAVSAVVFELRNHLFALFDGLCSNFNSTIALSKVSNVEEHQMKAELPCIKVTGIRDDAPAAAIPLGQLMINLNSDSESVGSHGRPKSVLESSRMSLKQASTLGKTFRIDDWIESLTTDSPSGIPPTTVNSLPYNTLQQIGPWLNIVPFDGDPQQWETFIGSFKAFVNDVVQSDAQRIAILSQLLSPRFRAPLASCRTVWKRTHRR